MSIRKEKFGSIDRGGVEVKRTSLELQDRKEVFRGFIPGSSIRTSKGYVGSKLDSLWARNILESLVNDDHELFKVAMESSIADISCVVEGGEFGSPFCLDNYGFFAAVQFNQQAEALKSHERRLVDENPAMFLSQREWDYCDAYLGRYAQYGKARMEKVTRGDTIPMIALREAAFEVAEAALREGADPLLYNENDEDLIDLLKDLYEELNENILLNFRLQKELSRRIIVPSELDNAMRVQENLKSKLSDMSAFLKYIVENFESRLKSIESDKWTKKKMELRREIVPYELRWNVDQENRVVELIQNCKDFGEFIEEKLLRHVKTVEELDMRNLLKRQQSFIDSDKIDQNNITDFSSVVMPDTPRKSGQTKRVERVKQMQISYVIDNNGERVYDYSSLPVDESSYAPTTFVKTANSHEKVEYR